MSNYPKPFWQHPENIERERQYFIGKLERRELLPDPARLLRLLKRLQPHPDQPGPIQDFDPIEIPAFATKEGSS